MQQKGVQKISQCEVYSVSKEAEYYVDFKNINLPQRQNAPKKVIQG
jgi:hypothetical protein